MRFVPWDITLWYSLTGPPPAGERERSTSLQVPQVSPRTNPVEWQA